MKPSAHIQTAIELLDSARSSDRPTDAVISAYFRDNRYIGSKDRAAISELVFDLLRHTARLSWWTKQGKARAQMLAYLVFVQKKTLQEITGLFNGEKYAPYKLAPEENGILSTYIGKDYSPPEMPEDVANECPPWAYTSLKNRFGAGFADEMQALLNSAPLDIRVNTLKAARAEVLAELKNHKTEAAPCSRAPNGIRVEGRPALAQLELYKNGSIEIQDEGSQLLIELVAAQPGMAVVDFCAGAGGKTLALAAAMKNKGRLVACDIMERRLLHSRERLKRAGVDNCELRPLKSETDDWVKRNEGKFDRVLIDAPCSGTGTWRRNPDARWKVLGPALNELVAIQARILASAARLVKSGGQLVYATCSLLPEENEKQVEAFLQSHGDFTLVPTQNGTYLSLTPLAHNTDGFFGAVLKKN